MVVCKFFLQGNCRYGENCKFEHQNVEARSSTSILRQQNFNAANSGNVDINTLVQAVANDMVAAEKGGQWLLSCYSAMKGKPNFPGFDERSFEEVRLGCYEAQKNGTFEQFKQQLQQVLQENALKVKALQNPTPEIVNMLKNVYNVTGNYGSANNPFGGNQGGSNIFGGSSGYGQNQNFLQQSQQSIFGMPSATTATSVFGAAANKSIFSNVQQQQPNYNQQQQSIFSGNNVFKPFNGCIFSNQNPGAYNQQGQSTFTGFNQPNYTANSSIFGGGNNPVGAQQASIFNTQIQQQQQQQQQQQPSIMFNQQQPPSVFNQNYQQPAPQQQQFMNPQNQQGIFAQQQQQQQQPNVPTTFTIQQNSPFNYPQQQQPNYLSNNSQQQSSNPFGNSNQNTMMAAANNQNPDYYSKPENLTPEDIQNFNSDVFEFGKIPEKPPTAEMCL